MAAMYPGISDIIAYNRLRVHICKINDMLVETDVRIVGKNGFYKLVARKGSSLGLAPNHQ